MKALGPTFALAVAALVVSCAPAPENAGRHIRPHLSPVALGDLWVLPSGETPDETSSQYVPYSWTLLLQSTGTDNVKIQSVCLVGNDRGVFAIEGPDDTDLGPDQMAAVRITYDSDGPSPGGNPDDVALVVQSTADDYPTLVVPVCARTVPDGQERGTVECTSPVQVAPGERDDSLCAQ